MTRHGLKRTITLEIDTLDVSERLESQEHAIDFMKRLLTLVVEGTERKTHLEKNAHGIQLVQILEYPIEREGPKMHPSLRTDA